MFSIKILLFRVGHEMVPLIWSWMALLRSGQGHFEFFKNSPKMELPIFQYIVSEHSCNLSQELFKTL